MRLVLVPVMLALGAFPASVLTGCDQLNKPVPVPTFGPTTSPGSAPAATTDAGSDGGMPALPGEEPAAPRFSPQPGDVSL